jgi:hypothetical protein
MPHSYNKHSGKIGAPLSSTVKYLTILMDSRPAFLGTSCGCCRCGPCWQGTTPACAMAAAHCRTRRAGRQSEGWAVNARLRFSWGTGYEPRPR